MSLLFTYSLLGLAFVSGAYVITKVVARVWYRTKLEYMKDLKKEMTSDLSSELKPEENRNGGN